MVFWLHDTLTSPTLTPTGRINGMSVSADGLLLCTTSDDKALKIFDVINFGEPQSSPVCVRVGSFILYVPLFFQNTRCAELFRAHLYFSDMINMFRLKYVPTHCVWLFTGGAATPAVAW